MTFKDLKKRVNLETTAQNQSKLFERLEHYDKEKYKEVTLDAAETVLGIFGLDLLRGIRTSIRV